MQCYSQNRATQEKKNFPTWPCTGEIAIIAKNCRRLPMLVFITWCRKISNILQVMRVTTKDIKTGLAILHCHCYIAQSAGRLHARSREEA